MSDSEVENVLKGINVIMNQGKQERNCETCSMEKTCALNIAGVDVPCGGWQPKPEQPDIVYHKAELVQYIPAKEQPANKCQVCSHEPKASCRVTENGNRKNCLNYKPGKSEPAPVCSWQKVGLCFHVGCSKTQAVMVIDDLDPWVYCPYCGKPISKWEL